jgi:predicted glycoside hydrolase/deacetylase ChbG (UPF0249 family)
MVFMADSERSATLARDNRVDTGLHLNLTAPFTAKSVATALSTRQQRIAAYLRHNRFSGVLFNPRLVSSFDYVVRAQLDEFERLYGTAPARIDGHHHMHLCANVLLQRLLPAGVITRRHFTFAPGEKHFANRAYRGFVNARLARRFRLADALFNLAPLDIHGRLARIAAVARTNIVELESHPALPNEYEFLRTGGVARHFRDVNLVSFAQLSNRAPLQP